MSRSRESRRPIWLYVLIAIVLAAVLGVGSFSVIFSGWSDFQTATTDEAAAGFEAEIAQLNDQRPYLTISDNGSVEAHRALEQPESTKLAALHMIAYDPAAERMTKVRFPFWFVQVKTTNSLNLGTLVSLLSQDWENLDLSVTEDDLMRRGPGLVLDHTREDGGRILLWSE